MVFLSYQYFVPFRCRLVVSVSVSKSDCLMAYHSPIDGYLGSFQFGANVDEAVINILMKSFLGRCLPPLVDKYLVVELFGS